MTFKTALILTVMMTTPATAEPIKRIEQRHCDHVKGFWNVKRCVDLAWDSIHAGERAEVLERSAAIEKDPAQAAKYRLQAKIKSIEAESKAEMYRLEFPKE